MPRKSETYFSTTIEKGLRILSLFNQDRNKFSLSEISRLTKINKTSSYRFVNTFLELGFLRKNAESKMISLGPKAIALGHGFLRGFDLLEVIKPIVDNAVKTYKATVDVALLDGDALLIVYRWETGNTLTYRLPTVTRSLHCSAIGKSVLAFLPEDKLAEMIKLSPPRKFRSMQGKKNTLAPFLNWQGKSLMCYPYYDCVHICSKKNCYQLKPNGGYDVNY